jgi:hypothetical protein
VFNVSRWSIANPVPSILLFIMLTVAGLLGFRAMKIQQFPDIDLPMVSVTASLPGAAPAQMETEVARRIENALASAQGLKHLYTKVQDGVATVTAEFRLEKPTQEAVDDVRDAVSRMRSDLPADLRDPVIAKMDLAGTPVLSYTVASDRADEEALSWFVDNDGQPSACWRCAAWARSRASAAPTARCRWSWTRPHAGAGRHGGRAVAPVEERAAGGGRRPRPARRRRAVGAHHRHRADGRRAGGAGDPAGRRPPLRLDQVATVSATRWPSGAAAPPERQAGGGLRGGAGARRRRGRRARRRARGAGRAEGAPRATSRSPRPSTSSTRCRRTSTAR